MKNVSKSILKNLAAAALAFAGTTAFATTFTLKENGGGPTYTCSPGGTGTSDPQCTTNIQKLCDDKTIYSDEECFSKAVEACRNGATSECASDVFTDCDNQTIYSDEQCFDQSLRACGGKVAAIQALMHAAREKALLDVNKQLRQ